MTPLVTIERTRLCRVLLFSRTHNNTHRVDLLDNTRRALVRHSVSADTIEFEITETAAMVDVDSSMLVLEQLRDLGVVRLDWREEPVVIALVSSQGFPDLAQVRL